MKTPRLLIVCISLLAFPSCADDGDAKRRLQQATNAASEYTKDAALMVVAILLEIKIGHGRGAILVVPFMDDPGEAFSNSDEGESLSEGIGKEP